MARGAKTPTPKPRGGKPAQGAAAANKELKAIVDDTLDELWHAHVGSMAEAMEAGSARIGESFAGTRERITKLVDEHKEAEAQGVETTLPKTVRSELSEALDLEETVSRMTLVEGVAGSMARVRNSLADANRKAGKILSGKGSQANKTARVSKLMEDTAAEVLSVSGPDAHEAMNKSAMRRLQQEADAGTGEGVSPLGASLAEKDRRGFGHTGNLHDMLGTVAHTKAVASRVSRTFDERLQDVTTEMQRTQQRAMRIERENHARANRTMGDAEDVMPEDDRAMDPVPAPEERTAPGSEGGEAAPEAGGSGSGGGGGGKKPPKPEAKAEGGEGDGAEGPFRSQFGGKPKSSKHPGSKEEYDRERVEVAKVVKAHDDRLYNRDAGILGRLNLKNRIKALFNRLQFTHLKRGQSMGFVNFTSYFMAAKGMAHAYIGIDDIAPAWNAITHRHPSMRKADDLVRALFDEKADVPEWAHSMARRLTDYLNKSMQRMNRAYTGGYAMDEVPAFRLREDYRVPTVHNPMAMQAMGPQRWVEAIRDDVKVWDHEAGDYVDPDDEMLEGFYWQILKRDDPLEHGGYNQGGRQIQFKDADGWLKYHSRMGFEDVFSVILQEVDMRERHIAMTRLFGSDPVNHLTRLLNTKGLFPGKKIERDGVLEVVNDDVRQLFAELRNAMGVTDRWFVPDESAPDMDRQVSWLLGNFFVPFRHLAGKVALRNAVISTPIELAQIMMRAGFFQVPAVRTISHVFGSLPLGRKAIMEDMARSGLMTDSVIYKGQGVQRQQSLGGFQSGRAHRLTNAALEATGFTYAVDVMRHTYAGLIQGELSNLAARGMRFRDLDPDLANHLKNHAFGQDEWDMLVDGFSDGRFASDMRWGGQTSRWLDPGRMPRDLAERWIGMIATELHFASGNSNFRMQARLYGEHKRGTVQREARETLFHFWQWNMTTIAYNIYPTVVGYGASDPIRRLRQVGGVSTYMITMGWMSNNLRMAVRGDDRAFRMPATHREAMRQLKDAIKFSGGVGWLADVPFSPGNLARNPTTSVAGDAWRTIGGAATLDKEDFLEGLEGIQPAWQSTMLLNRVIIPSLLKSQQEAQW